MRGTRWPFDHWGKGRLDQIEVVNGQGRTVTIQGLGYIQWGIITFMVGSVITLIFSILSNLIFKELNSVISIFLFGIIMVIVSFIFLILAMVFVLLGIYKLKRGDLSTDKEYAQDLRICTVSSIIYLTLRTVAPFGVGFLLIPIGLLSHSNIPLTLAITNAVYMIIGFFSFSALIVMFTYPLGHWTSKRSFDLLITFAALTCFVLVGNRLLSTSVDLMFIIGLENFIGTVRILDFLFRLLNFIAFIILMVAYSRTLNSLKGKVRNAPKEQMNLIPKSMRFIRPEGRPSPKPSRVILIVILLIIPLVILSSVLDYVQMDRLLGPSGMDFIRNDNEELIPTNSVEAVRDGELVQGESIDEVIEVGMPLVRVDIVLSWTDEASDPTWTNNPDSFNLRVGLISIPDGETIDMEEKIGANSVNGPGEISISFSYRSDSPKMVGSIDILVTLVETGDQVGSYLGLRTRADDSNSFSLTISYVHLVD